MSKIKDQIQDILFFGTSRDRLERLIQNVQNGHIKAQEVLEALVRYRCHDSKSEKSQLKTLVTLLENFENDLYPEVTIHSVSSIGKANLEEFEKLQTFFQPSQIGSFVREYSKSHPEKELPNYMQSYCQVENIALENSDHSDRYKAFIEITKQIHLYGIITEEIETQIHENNPERLLVYTLDHIPIVNHMQEADLKPSMDLLIHLLTKEKIKISESNFIKMIIKYLNQDQLNLIIQYVPKDILLPQLIFYYYDSNYEKNDLFQECIKKYIGAHADIEQILNIYVRNPGENLELLESNKSNFFMIPRNFSINEFGTYKHGFENDKFANLFGKISKQQKDFLSPLYKYIYSCQNIPIAITDDPELINCSLYYEDENILSSFNDGSIITHEITHGVLSKLFDNKSNPYIATDIQMQSEYHAIARNLTRESVKHISRFLAQELPLEMPFKVAFKEPSDLNKLSYKEILDKIQCSYDEYTKIELCSKILSLYYPLLFVETLTEIEKSETILSFNKLDIPIREDIESNALIEYMKDFYEKFDNYIGNVDDARVIMKLFELPNFYNNDEFDAELIARITELKFYGNESKLISPMVEYWAKYIEPALNSRALEATALNLQLPVVLDKYVNDVFEDDMHPNGEMLAIEWPD